MRDKPLNQDKMRIYAIEFMVDLVALILTKKKSKEMQAGIVAAMADVLVLVCCKMVGRKIAYEEIVPMAIAHGFQMADKNKDILEANEQDTNTKASGS